MKNSFFIIAFLSICLNSASAQLKDISIPQIWEDYRFYPKMVPGFNFMKDGKHYSVQESNEIIQYDLTSGKKTSVIYSSSDLNFSSYTFSADENKLVLETEREQIYRRSSKANFYVWDRKSEKLTAVSKTGKQRYATLDAQGNKIAFVRSNNLFYKEVNSDKEIQITTDGAHNKIINGATDWVYEEEFSMSKAFAWSPEGTKIAFLRFDETMVKEFTYTSYNNELYPIYNTFKYPKAGEKNSDVTVHIYDLTTKKTVQVQVKGDKDQYIPRIKWVDDNQLCVTRLNRHQNNLALLLANPKNGSTKVLLKEENKYFIDIHDNLTFLDNGEFIWTSDEDGYNHIYLYNMKGKKVRQLTKGNFDVIRFYGLDAQKKMLYFQAAKEGAMHRGIYHAPLAGGAIKTLHHQKGVNSAQFSSTFDYYVNTYSNATTPPSYKVYKTQNNQLIRTIEENQPLNNQLKEYNMGKHSFFEFTNSDDVVLNGWVIKPADFDPNKKYPVFMYVYGGPGSQTVMDRWGGQNYMWFQMLAQKGYIIVSVDNRGTDARGQAFRKSTYMNLGGLETKDQIEVAKHFASQPYVDAKRIGIFGWSFGGYLSTSCLAKGADVFKMAIAVAPVINWKWYDTIYTERFMRSPKENNDGYEENSPINFAGQIRGKYLLVHGMADDNVHFQNAAEMARALIAKNIPFDEAYYPNKNHGIYGGYTRAHLYNKMTNFILDNL
ncbi:S9 family peptidase [Aureispira anguillae]|uniref:S9 family peptidase n=1 Tax=Aureispira anguillae TaxID=2864201 RepID=A0A915YKM1_9BACT|nr:S9 family peptidase [Aureispira anguillae]BDS14828.1 S9 family peptidase [Aureispira anguillae]